SRRLSAGYEAHPHPGQGPRVLALCRPVRRRRTARAWRPRRRFRARDAGKFAVSTGSWRCRGGGSGAGPRGALAGVLARLRGWDAMTEAPLQAPAVTRTPRLLLRLPEAADAPSFGAALARNFERLGAVPAPEQLLGSIRLRREQAERGERYTFGVFHDGELIG